MIQVKPDDWLVVVDYQNDFIPPDGALAVPGGDKLVGRINELLGKFPHTLATRDWHPENHYSFQKNGGEWPKHCVQGSRGAEFYPELEIDDIDFKLKKGFDPGDRTDYSGFSGQTPAGRRMVDVLRGAGGGRLFVAGLALDYCVWATALDGVENGFDVFLLKGCTKPVDEEDGEKALREIRSNGGKVITSTDLEF